MALDDKRREWARRLVVLAQALTLLSTWPLWSVRMAPPNLPLVGLPLPCGALLMLSLAVAWRWKREGALLHAVLFGLSVLLDTTRLTAAPCSMVLLLLLLSLDGGERLVRPYLASMWCWAGLNKLLSPAFFGGVVPVMVTVLPAWLPGREHAGLLVALLELTLGVLALMPRGHRGVAVPALVLHLGALGTLLTLRINEGVWAWNLLLALLPLLVFAAPLKTRPPLASALFFVLPALYYVGLMPPALAHQLYSGAEPTTLTCRADGCIDDLAMREGLDAFGVPVPPSVMTLRAYFFATCAPGDTWLVRSHLRGAGYDQVIEEARCLE